MLATLEHTNIQQQMLTIASTFTGLSARQLLGRLGIPSPAPHVLTDLGLTDEAPLGFGAEEMTRRFLHAFRWEFVRAAAGLRRRLFRQFVAAGIQPGQTVAVVDMVTTSRLPHLAAGLLQGMFDVEVLPFAFLVAPRSVSAGAHFPVTAFADTLDLPPSTGSLAQRRSALFSLALASDSGGDDAGRRAGLAEGVSLYSQQTRSEASASDLVSPLFERLCAPTPDFPGPIPAELAPLA